MIHIWHVDESYPENLVGRWDERKSPDYFDLRKCRPYSPPSAKAHVSFSAPADAVRKMNYLENSSSIPLVSPKLVDLFSRVCPNDLQFLDAVVSARGESVPGFKAVNVLHAGNFVDLKRSDFVPVLGTQAVMKFNKLRFGREDLGGHRIVREGSYTSYILVDEVLREGMMRIGVAGARFLRDEDVRP